jgi:ABC-type molybdate transport system substrate-binding protein
MIATSTNPDAQAFLDFLFSPEAAALFTAQGFKVLP